MSKQELITKLQNYFKLCTDIRESTLIDSSQYDLIFSQDISRAINTLLVENEVGKLDYYDPDTSYEEDMDAFINALDNKITELKTQYIEEVPTEEESLINSFTQRSHKLK